MAECIKCGVSDKRALLFDVISRNGIVKICRKCNEEEKFPLIKQVSKEPLIEKKKGIYEKLARYAGIDAERHKKKFVFDEREDLLKKQETSLKDIVDRNFKKTVPEKAVPREDMVYNFHWIIMRARRSKKITQSQFAHEISEPEQAIRTIEQGILPENPENLILKIENYLGIKIRKKIHLDSLSPDDIDVSKSLIKKQFQENRNFDSFTTRNLTIQDLKNMENEETEKFSENKRDFPDPFAKDNEKLLREETDLTEEEIERIIYGR